jgi:tetratricopeptide (TPR) repeat protein
MTPFFLAARAIRYKKLSAQSALELRSPGMVDTLNICLSHASKEILSNMKTRYAMMGWLFAAFLCLSLASCSNTLPRFGLGGRYEEGRDQFLRGRGGDMDRAVVSLEYVVGQDPTYKHSLTYLGRAYYRKERYKDAYAILQRAVAVNQDDEIAWLALGVTQLRLGQNDKGIETLKGGITLAGKALNEGYRNYDRWDIRGVVKSSVRRCAFYIAKGPEEKENIVQSTDRLLALIDDEENFQKNAHTQNMRQFYGP